MPLIGKPGEVGGRRHLGRVELDHPVVHAVADSGHAADGSVVSHPRRQPATGATAVTGGEPDQLAGVIVANGCESAVASLNDDARAAAQHH